MISESVSQKANQREMSIRYRRGIGHVTVGLAKQSETQGCPGREDGLELRQALRPLSRGRIPLSRGSLGDSNSSNDWIKPTQLMEYFLKSQLIIHINHLHNISFQHHRLCLNE